jgi:hypothetical protein
MRHRMTAIMMTLVLTIFLATSVSAAILLCISNENLKGEETVGSCVAKEEQFAVVDEYGFVRILTPEEIALTKVLNPKVLETRAFGMKYIQEAPKLPPMPSLTQEAP